MIYKTDFILDILRLSKRRKFILGSNENGISIQFDKRIITINYAEISDLKISPWIYWCSLRIKTKQGKIIKIRGIRKYFGEKLKIEYKIWVNTKKFKLYIDKLRNLYNKLSALYHSEHYICQFDVDDWLNECEDIKDILDINLNELYINEDTKKMFSHIKITVERTGSIVKALNKKFITNELEKYRDFFDRVEKHPLTAKQRLAVIIDENNTLVNAGAGTGKTTVISAKVAYILKKKLVSPDKILLLAFTKDACKAMKTRVLKILNQYHDTNNTKIDVKTFHAFGLDILKEYSKSKRNIYIVKEKEYFNMIVSTLTTLLDDPIYRNKLLKIFILQHKNYIDKFKINSDKKYNNYIKSIDLRTLQGEAVKSFEECEIANFLYCNNIKYEYEKAYEYDTRTEIHRQYLPDFYLIDYGIYIEHFGINRKGEPPPFISKEKYISGINWKRQLHKKNNTKLVETYSYQKREGNILEILKTNLEEFGVVFLARQEIYDQLNQVISYKGVAKIIGTCLSHYKSNILDIEKMKSNVENYRDPNRSLLFLEIFNEVYERYQQRLYLEGKIDFSDMMLKANKILKNNNVIKNYNYIIVDEFQDTTVGRKKLICELLRQNPRCKTFCVGDDWQSIYRFTGSDISVMTNFEKQFGKSTIVSLDKTFRFNNKICDVASTFIQKNPNQLKKKLSTFEIENTPKVSIVQTTNNSTYTAIDNILKNISGVEKKKKIFVFLLGRYRKNNILEEIRFQSIKYKYENIIFKFHTFHSSKGLEADYIIINGMYSASNTIEDDPIINIFLSNEDNYPNAEERRAFYVALTRAKKSVYLLCDSKDVSLFTLELMGHQYEINIIDENTKNVTFELCKLCKRGIMVQRKSRYGKFLGCSRYPNCNQIINIKKTA